MSYVDELILKKREQMKMEAHTELDDGLYLNGELVHFERKELLETLSIMLPDSWKLMPEEYARVKYPSEFRPQVILTTPDLSINLGFTAFSEMIQNGEPGKVTERVMSAIHRNNPDYQIYPYEVLEKINGCWFAFRSHAMDSDLYNMMLLVPVGKRLVLASFNCPYKDYQKWKKAVLMMWNTIMKVKVGL